MRERKITLSEREIPRQWYNVAADDDFLSKKLADPGLSDAELKMTIEAVPQI